MVSFLLLKMVWKETGNLLFVMEEEEREYERFCFFIFFLILKNKYTSISSYRKVRQKILMDFTKKARTGPPQLIFS